MIDVTKFNPFKEDIDVCEECLSNPINWENSKQFCLECEAEMEAQGWEDFEQYKAMEAIKEIHNKELSYNELKEMIEILETSKRKLQSKLMQKELKGEI